jgi:hypothetical protein
MLPIIRSDTSEPFLLKILSTSNASIIIVGYVDDDTIVKLLGNGTIALNKKLFVYRSQHHIQIEMSRVS